MEEKNFILTSPEAPSNEAVQYWQNYQEVQPTVIWKLDSNSEFVQMPVEYTVVSQSLQNDVQELNNENKVMFIRNAPNTSYSLGYAKEEIVEEESGKAESSFDSGDIEVDVGNDNYTPETVEVVKKKAKPRRKAQGGPKKRMNLVKIAEGKAKTVSKASSFKDDELTRLEDNAEQVAERFRLGCDCDEGCFDNFNAEKVFRHKLNIADLTKAEHDMYLMGVIHSSMQNPEETRRKKGRLRQRNSYAYDGKRVCLTAFLYLEHVTLYQIKRIRKHLRNHGVSPRIHGNHGRKPFNTLPLDIYQHATHFVQTFIEQHVKTYYGKAKDSNKTCHRLPAEYSKKTLHDEYRQFCQQSMPSTKIMQYSTFTSFFKKQFPNVKFRKGDKVSDRRAADEPAPDFNRQKRFKKKRDGVVQTATIEETAQTDSVVIFGPTEVVLDADASLILHGADGIATHYVAADVAQ